MQSRGEGAYLRARKAHMTTRLVYYGNPTLRQVAKEIETVDQRHIELIESMFNTMYKAGGIGLAAPQVNHGERIIVIDLEYYKGPSLALINPVITERSREVEPYEEGCLSVPGIMADIIRPVEISVNAISQEGEELSFDADGLLARVIQHEVDHLDGILFIDYLEDFTRKELTAELKKIKKLNKAS
ncbi:MAG: peptide deformylase [Spirochaetes bacterium]|nr:MAG: peptide deformylase [Spirochaetota bacterium]